MNNCIIDHTLLKADASKEAVIQLCGRSKRILFQVCLRESRKRGTGERNAFGSDVRLYRRRISLGANTTRKGI